MTGLFRGVRRAALPIAFLCLQLASAPGQISHFGKPVPSPTSAAKKSFSELTAPAAADPADAVCARSAVGSIVSDPPLLSSQNGVLQVSFQYQTTVDVNGLTRYCYVYTNAAGQSEEAPTLQVNPGDQLVINFNNNLPVPSASDASAHAMSGMKMKPAATSTSPYCSATSVDSGSTNLHFHGTNLPPVCGQDEVIHTIIPAQASFTYTVQIPANEPPGIYWYHPHAHGFSDAQVIAGATGVIEVEGIQNVNPAVANLPQRVFVLRDQDLPASEANDSGIPQTDLSINYVPVLYPSYSPAVIQTGASEQEFWRVLNSAADTLLDVEFVDNGVPQPMQIVSVDGVPLTDGNGNPTTTTVTDYPMSPASRIEFIVTTPAVGDTTAQLATKTWDNGPTGDYDPGRPLAKVVAVSSSAAAAQAKRMPAHTADRKVTRFTALDTATPVNQRTLYFSVAPDFSAFYITPDGQTPVPFSMDGPPNITVTEGTVEQWTIQNRSTMDHNFHIHQLHFQTLAINGTPVSDPTLRDTIDVPHWSGNASDPYPSVTLMMDFRDPNIVGTFVYHCHILSHEDLGMMGSIQVLPGATTTTLTASPATASAGSSVTLTATVSPAAGSGTPTGTVTFLNGTTTLGTGTLNSSGVATLMLTSLPIGSDSLTASYGGDTSFATSVSTATPVTVTPAATTTALTAAPASVISGATVTFTAVVTAPPGTGTPSGIVTFSNGATALGTATLDGTGTGVYATTALAVGTASITASYAGNASFAASVSSPATVTVAAPPPPDFGVAATPATMSVAPGASGTTTLTVTPQNGFNSAVTFTCSGLPSEAACTFTPATVTPNGTQPSTTSVSVTTTGTAAGAVSPAGSSPAAPLYALVLPGLGALLGIGRFRRRLPVSLRRLSVALFALALALGVGACGGGSSTPSNPGTPAGTSTVTITATSGTEVHTTTFALTVQ